MMSRKIGGSPVGKDGPRAESGTGTGRARDIAALLRRLLRCNRGAAAVEFGLSAPLLLGVLVPVADLGLAFSTQQQLQDAVQAGALYATTHPWNQNAASAIASAVTAATPLSGISTSPSPYQMCGCPSGTSVNGGTSGSGITTASCGSTCSNGETAGYYVVISAQRTYTPILPYSLLGSSRTLTAQSTIRIR
jgi:Flp pilus assembly protein TadG